MDRVRAQVAFLVDGIDRRRRWVAVALVVLGLGGAWALALSSGSLTAVSRHWFYLPVVFAAVRFGLAGALVSGVAAALLAGPAVLTAPGAASAHRLWLTRGSFFVVVGVFVAGLIAVLRDSQRQALELAEQEQRRATQHATLIQTVSHEFRTPLTILHGGIQTLARRQDEVGERLRPLIGGLERAERRLDELVSIVLTTAEAMDEDQRLAAEPVALVPLVGELAESLRHVGGRQRVVAEIAADAQTLVTVPGYLQLALRCVIDNGLRFSPADRPVTVTATRRADALAIAVHDHGDGFDPDFRDQAFEAFTQADPSSRRTHGGLGMGLFTARQVADRLNGTISIRHGDGDRGTTIVELVLPQQRDTDRVGAPRPAARRR